MRINELARAKINLCLHVTGQRDDGYHLLDSIVVFADIGDQISITPEDGFSLKIIGPFAKELGAGTDNLVMQAAQLFEKDCKGAAITLTKNLPVASGIGGGSADAAATLRAMVRMTGTSLPPDAGRSLGADVPVCLQSRSCRMQGVGDVITPLVGFPKYFAVLVCPNIKVSTSDVFGRVKPKENPPIAQIPDFQFTNRFLCEQRNDLEEPSARMVKETSQCLSEIDRTGAFLARMSGSGATCFGLFETQEQVQKGAAKLEQKHPAWWVKACVLG